MYCQMNEYNSQRITNNTAKQIINLSQQTAHIEPLKKLKVLKIEDMFKINKYSIINMKL